MDLTGPQKEVLEVVVDNAKVSKVAISKAEIIAKLREKGDVSHEASIADILRRLVKKGYLRSSLSHNRAIYILLRSS